MNIKCVCEDGSSTVVNKQLLSVVSPTVLKPMIESLKFSNKRSLHTDGRLVPSINLPVKSKDVLNLALFGLNYVDLMDSILFLAAHDDAPHIILFGRIHDLSGKILAKCLLTCPDADRGWTAIKGGILGSARMDCLLRLVKDGRDKPRHQQLAFEELLQSQQCVMHELDRFRLGGYSTFTADMKEIMDRAPIMRTQAERDGLRSLESVPGFTKWKIGVVRSKRTEPV